MGSSGVSVTVNGTAAREWVCKSQDVVPALVYAAADGPLRIHGAALLVNEAAPQGGFHQV